MNKKLLKIKFVIIVSLFLFNIGLYAQNYSFKKKSIYVNQIIVKFDTVPTLPYKFKIYNSQGNVIPDSIYIINFKKSIIEFKEILNDSITIFYIPSDIYIPKSFLHKSKNIIIKDTINILPSRTLFYVPDNNYNEFFSEDLSKRGSISRAIRVGNQQNMSVSSTLNLQLTGKIGDDFEMVAALTDNQVPFQPSGNTQQIQEFDKIYIQIFNKKNHFTIGDYDFRSNDHIFLKVNRKSQGFQYIFNNKDSIQSTYIQTSNSVVKGKYQRILFNGKEGIQGPYKLHGINNEPFIVVLAGTERIYLDGKLLTRGEENDYIIDYNTAELTFTAKNHITKDSRIIAEFEYSDRNYSRFSTFNKLQFKNEKAMLQFQIFHEFDAKNQTLQQELSDYEKNILSQAGNDENKMIVPFISLDTIRNENQIYYKLIDTIVNGITYDSVLVYSTDSTAIYKAGFTYVGKNKGNYVQISSSANGRVFKWIAPVNNVPQGNFEPIKKLIAPVKHTVVATTLSYQLLKKTNISVDVAFSDFDKNTFSNKDNNKNKGLALRTALNQKLTNENSKHQLSYDGYFQHISVKYVSPEHFKSIEFQRDWNYQNLYLNDELQTGMRLNYNFRKHLQANIGNDWLIVGNNYRANKKNSNVIFRPQRWNFNHSASLLNTEQKNVNTKFFRHYSTNEKIFSIFKLGLKTSIEDNLWHIKSNDSLLSNSFKFYQWNSYFGSSDTCKWQWLVRYGQREDYFPKNNKLHKSFTTQEAGLEIQSDISKRFLMKSVLSIRDVKLHTDTNLSKEQNILSKNEFSLRIAKNSINIATVHETNAGIEPKRHFTYIEVPPGQGIYTWIDYNQNAIKELNEFEVAKYPDQATYIRIFSTTLDYIRVYSSKISQIIHIRPELCWSNSNGIKKFLTNFSNLSSFQQEVKTTSNDIIQKILPIQTNDSNQLLVNNLFRNVFSIRKNHPVWSIDYIYQRQQNGQLLIQGIDSRVFLQHNLTLRWNFLSAYSLFISPSVGYKKFESEFFYSKSYYIKFKQLENNFYIQPDNFTRIGIGNKYTEKENKIGTEKLKATAINFELTKNIQSDNQINLKSELIQNKYNGNTNTSIAYEILDALQPGWNLINTIRFQRNLSSKIQMVITYQSRSSKNNKTIHTGNVEIRAWF